MMPFSGCVACEAAQLFGVTIMSIRLAVSNLLNRRRAIILVPGAIAGLLATAALPAPALADGWHHDGWDDHRGWDGDHRGWDHDHWRHERWEHRGWAPAPIYVAPRVYYPPPYYAPQYY